MLGGSAHETFYKFGSAGKPGYVVERGDLVDWPNKRAQKWEFATLQEFRDFEAQQAKAADAAAKKAGEEKKGGDQKGGDQK